jgi:two-component system phosphate regulon sensor histidine kinase PhoR
MKLISTKIFIGYLLVIVLFAGLILYITFQTTKSHYIQTFSNDLRNLNFALVDQVIPYVKRHQYTELNQYVVKKGKTINTRITVIDTAGIVLADSKMKPAFMENHKSRPEISASLDKGGSATKMRYSSTLHNDMLYVANPLYHDGEIIGVLRVSLFLSDINELTNRLSYEVLQITLVVILISLIIVVIFSRNISRPLKELSKASRKVALGDFDAKVKILRRDEIYELAENFNNMTENLKNLFKIVNTQKEEYHNLVASIQDGIVVMNTEGLVLLNNTGFLEISKSRDVAGRHYSELIDNPEFENIIGMVLDEKSNFTKEIEIQDKHYLCSASFINPKSEIVLLFHDISEIKQLEQIKKDFVVNVSHELKTPLTAIKGFVETLEDDMEGEHLHYVEIISRHTNRLINIVQDLLTLSELEDRGNLLMLSKVDINIICKNMIKIFEQKITQKGLEIILEIEEGLPKIKLDPFRIEQVFVNLIDNAIKYTDEGHVQITIYSEGEFAVIEVADTGGGIPVEHHGRIFERFYIVDKSRSRKVGGTGLGLSIVKHIILLHGGDIKIDSSYKKGTKFIFKLPFEPQKTSVLSD